MESLLCQEGLALSQSREDGSAAQSSGVIYSPTHLVHGTGDNKSTLGELRNPPYHSGSPPCHRLTLEHTLGHCAAFHHLPMHSRPVSHWQPALPRTWQRKKKEASWSRAPHSQPQGHSEEATVSPSFSFPPIRGRVPSLSQST